MNRLTWARGLVVLLVLSGCAPEITAGGHPDEGSSIGSDGEGGAPSTSGGGGEDGGGGSSATPDSSAALDDTHTLDVVVWVGASVEPDESIAEANIQLSVSVTETLTGSPVKDAVVTGGPVGSPSTLVYDVYSSSSYTGGATGYVRDWEFSVERGADHVKGIVLVGPSPYAVTTSPSEVGAIVWNPSQEAGVATSGCVTAEGPPTSPAVCADAVDDVAPLLLQSADGLPLPLGQDRISVDRARKVPVGVAGSGAVELAVSID